MSLRALVFICELALFSLVIFGIGFSIYVICDYRETCNWRFDASRGNCVKLSFEQFLTFYNLNPKGYYLFPDHVSRCEPYQEILFSTVRDYRKYKRLYKEIKNKKQIKKLLQYVNDDIEKHEQDAKECFKKANELVRKM